MVLIIYVLSRHIVGKRRSRAKFTTNLQYEQLFFEIEAF